MKKRFPSAIAFPILAVLILSGLPDSAPAEVNVNVNIGTPPVVVAEPAEVVLIPEFGVYFVPDGDVDLFFHLGFWWSPRGDRWYRSRVWNGPWVVVERRIVPRKVVRVPRDYRVRYGKVKRVPYGQWKKAHHRKADGNGRRGDHHKRKEHKKKWK
jgi:hypothetical protein